MIWNPINAFKGFKKVAKRGKHKKHATRAAIGQSIRTRLVNGPELNILLLGIPFLIDFGISYGVKNKFFTKEVPNDPVEEEVVVVEFDPNGDANSSEEDSDFDASDLDPLPPAPFSDVAFRLYAKLVEHGMTEESARKICSGEMNGEELSDHMSDEDVAVFMGLYGTVFKEGVTEV